MLADIGAAMLDDLRGLSIDQYRSASWAIFAWLLAASLNSWLHEVLPLKSRPWLDRAHERLAKGIWLATFLAGALCMLLAFIANHTATEHSFYAETTGSWDGVDYLYDDLRPDAYTLTVSRSSPILKDLQSSQSYRARCKHADSSCSNLLSNHGTSWEKPFKTWRAKISVWQARVTLRSTVFGKHTLERVEYIEFTALPTEIRLWVINQTACSRSTYEQWQLLQAYPMETGMLQQARKGDPCPH